MTWCGCVCDVAEDIADSISDTASDIAESVVNSVNDAIDAIESWAVETGHAIAGFAEDIASQVWDWITETASDIWDWVKEVAGDVWEWAKDVSEDAWNWVKEASSDAWDWIEATANTVWDKIVLLAEKIGDFWDDKVIPFLEKVWWVATHIDEFLLALGFGLWCLITGQDEKEYDIIEGMYLLDEDILSQRKVAFLPINGGKYVIFSDLHLFTADDPKDKFRKIGNHELYKAILVTYYHAGYTLIENGDIEDLWMKESDSQTSMMTELCFVLGYPLGDIVEEDYENVRIPHQAVRIFENNADVYQIIGNLYHDKGNYIRIIGNHDDIWQNDKFLDGLRVVYPGINVYDYAFIGHYTNIHKHNGERPKRIITHGHQIDAWNTYACRLAGLWITQAASGFPSLASEVKRRSWWRPLVEGSGFNNELSDSIMGIDEVEFFENYEDDFSSYSSRPQIILGHTHKPLIDPRLESYEYHPTLKYTGIGRFSEYINCGTAGRWEEFIWCVVLDNWNISLYGWTWGPDGKPLMYHFDGLSSDNLQAY